MSTFTPYGARALAISLLAVLSVGGCATTPVASLGPSVPAATEAGAGTGELDTLGDAVIGAVVTLPPDNPLGSRHVRVIDDYRAASGRRCRHVTKVDGENIDVVCRRADGHWSVTRGLADDIATR